MPKYSNIHPGVSRVDGAYRSRFEHKGAHYEKRFKTLAEAKSWRGQLKADMKRCPDGVDYIKGQWRVSVTHGLVTMANSFTSLDDAIALRERLHAQIRAGVFGQSDRREVKFDEFWIEFLEQKSLVISSSTRIRYVSTATNHLEPFFGDVDIRHIDRSMVRSWLKARLDNGVSVDALKRAAELLRQVLFMAVDESVIEANPIARLPLPKVVRSETKPLSKDQVEAVAKSCGRYEGMIKFMCLYGLRDGEMRSLRVSDVDFESQTVQVDSSFTKVTSGSEVEGPTKNRRSRTLPLTENAARWLRPYCEGRAPSDYLFTGARGGKLNYGWFRKKYLIPAGNLAGFSSLGMHTLRHTAATFHSTNSGDDVSTAKLLGHARVSTTQNHYIHKTLEDMKSGLERVEGILQ